MSFWEMLIEAAKARDQAGVWRLISKGNKNGRCSRDLYLDAGIWKAHFSGLYSSSPYDINFCPVSCVTLNNAEPLDFTLQETRISLNAVKPGKAPGLDKIPGDLWKHDTGVWGPYINLLSNYFPSGGSLPETWKGAEITTIFKKG